MNGKGADGWWYRLSFDIVAFTCAIGGIVFAILGYKLFAIGVTKIDSASAQFKSPATSLIITATAPGLFLMAFGAVVLVVTLVRKKAGGRGFTASA